MKKILSSCAALMFAASTAWAYPSPVAVIKNYEETADEIRIVRAAGETDGAESLLYPGDKIIGNVNILQIEYSPYTDGQDMGGEYVIRYSPPSDIWQVASAIGDYVGQFWDNVENVAVGASRGGESVMNARPRPCFKATLLMDQPVLFDWEVSKPTVFRIVDDHGKTVYEKKTDAGIRLLPRELKLQPGKSYIWQVEGDFYEYKFVVLDQEAERNLAAKLKEIEAANLPDDAACLKKARYVQLLSDTYPDKIDLYWLSLQWLESTKMTTKQNESEKEMLIRKFMRHLDKEMG